MGFYSGRFGSLIYLDKPVAKVRDWSLDYSNDMLETTKVSDFAPTFVPGRKAANGNATLLWYRLNIRDQQVFTQFDSLLTRLVRVGKPDTTAMVKMELRIGQADADTLMLNAYLTSANLGCASGELSSVSVSFQMTGDLLRGID